jgi:hypothetical protein
MEPCSCLRARMHWSPNSAQAVWPVRERRRLDPKRTPVFRQSASEFPLNGRGPSTSVAGCCRDQCRSRPAGG